MKRLRIFLASFALLAACQAEPAFAAGHHISDTLQATVEAVQKGAPPVAASAADAVKSISHDATTVVDKVIDKASSALGEITSKLEGAAPKAWSLVVVGTKAKAEATILVGLIMTISSLLSGMAFWNSFKKADWCDGNRYIFGVFMFGATTLISSISASFYILSSDAWAAYLSPEGYLAIQILNTTLSHT